MHGPAAERGPVLKSGLQETKDATIDLIAGAMGGVTCVYVGQPLDTIKVKLQTYPKLFTSASQCFATTFKKDGIRGLYAGTLPAVAANVAENSILFAAYGMCQKAVGFCISKKVENLSSLENATSGFFAAFFSSLALCPTELVKCRLQAMREMEEIKKTKDPKYQPKPLITPFKLTRQILSSEGIPGLFRGLTSTFAREMPGYFFFFGGYELSRSFLTPPGKSKDEIGTIRTIICGGIAGITLWTAIFPTDVIKSRVQVSGSTDSMRKVALDIYRKEGFSAFYNGLRPTIVRAFPATGALFLAYEFTKKTLHQLFPYNHPD